MSQAPRIPPAVWEAQRPRITELYVNQDKTLDEVIKIMTESGFHATKPQYIRKVNVNWKLQKNYTREKWQQASALVEKRQAEGKLKELRIDGKLISGKRRKKELRRYHGLPVDDDFKSQPPLFGPNQQNESLGLWEAANTLLPGVHTTEGMATGSLPLPEPPRHRSKEVLKHVRIKGQRLFELVPMLDDSVEIIQHQQPPWLQTFNSLVFLCSNNLMETKSSAYELLRVAISSGFLIKMKHLFTLSVPTLEIFARHLLFVALSVQGSKGIEALRFLLESGVSPDSTDPNECGCSALHEAVRVRKNRDAVELLLQFGADPNGKVEDGERNTPLNDALHWGGDRELSQMLIESGADVNLGSEKPLTKAVERQDLALTKLILEARADPKKLPAKGLSVLYFAIELQELSLVNILIEAGVNPNVSIDELHGRSIRFLIHQLNHCDDIRIPTPLHYAIFCGEVDIVKRLIEGGAVLDKFIDPEILKTDKTLRSNGVSTPLQMSIQKREYEITKVLLDAGAGIDFRHPATGTALQLVCSSTMEEGRKIEWTKALLAKGADINTLPGEDAGRTAMQAAAESGHHDLLKLLFTRGGNPFAPAAKKDGLTVFQAALKPRSTELVTYVFWELGSSCSCFSFFDGTNYLEEAVSTDSLELLETVLKFWNRHGLHWPKEFISSALKTAVRRGFIHHILGPNAESFTISLFTIPEEDISSLICESIWNAGTARTRTPILRGGETISVWCRHMRVFDLLMQRFIKPNLDCAQLGYPTPLWLAIHQELLTNKGADIHCSIDGSLTPLLVSLQRQNENAAVFLLSKGVDPNVVDVSGRYTALGFALDWIATLSTVQSLTNHGSDVNMPSVWGTPLEQAARGPFWHHDAIQRCQLLLATGADINADFGSTELKSAVASGHVELVKFLMEAGADVNASKTGMTALEVAVHNNNTELAKLLVEAGATFNTSSVQISSLQLALSKNDLELAGLFIAKGADIDDSTLGETLLQRAANLGNLELVKHLIDLGADVDAKVAGGPATALQYASMHGNVEIVKYLIEHGASVSEEASPFYETTALGLAVDNDHTEAALYLIEKGASIDKYPTAGGATLLQLAAEHGNHEIVTCLVENGAVVDAAPATKGGATALQLRRSMATSIWLFFFLRTELVLAPKEQRLMEELHLKERQSMADLIWPIFC
ncbi:ankyrin protein [Fusarium napiforme]|uniref:Ankyrin protein n=1 Tax=Fusarium napiforme TaxID=42672 RepID=A0A8H5K348_9HYPO|nr:ankyrin protein [Fusarium napiforme]